MQKTRSSRARRPLTDAQKFSALIINYYEQPLAEFSAVLSPNGQHRSSTIKQRLERAKQFQEDQERE